MNELLYKCCFFVLYLILINTLFLHCFVYCTDILSHQSVVPSATKVNNKQKSVQNFSKIVVDENIFVDQCKNQLCSKCNKQNWVHEWKSYAQGISPNLILKCATPKCNCHIKIITSETWHIPSQFKKTQHIQSRLNKNTALLFVAILLSGLTLTPVCRFVFLSQSTLIDVD